jgi:hypothetical protein
MHYLKMVRISAATLNILKCNVVLLSALKQMSIKLGVNKFHANVEAASKFQAPKGDMTSHTEDPQTLGASVQNLVIMATWLLGLEHLPIRKPPRPSKFFPVHHLPTSLPRSQYEILTQQYNKIIHKRRVEP